MTEIELRTFGFGSNHSANWATTTAQQQTFFIIHTFYYSFMSDLYKQKIVLRPILKIIKW